MKKDLIFTFLTHAILLISGLLVYKFAANLVGEDTFSKYALSRRIISFIYPALVIGLTTGIPRYIAFSGASSRTEYLQQDKYFLAGIIVLFINVLIFTFFLNIFKNYFTFLFFGNSEYAELILPISFMLIAATLHASCYSYYRGKLLMGRANALQLINSGIIPVLAFLMHTDLIYILSFTGLSCIFTSVIVMILIFKKLKWVNTTSLYSYIKELLYYGIQRVPGDFGMAALISLPAIITAHIAGVTEAGYVAFGIAILNMTGSFFSPFGLVLLPMTSKLISSGDIDKLKVYTVKLARSTLLLTLSFFIFFEIFAYEIIRIYLGEVSSDLIMIARIIMFGCFAYNFYVAMRSIIDACYVRAVNTMNIIVTLIFFLIAVSLVYILNWSYILLIGSFVAAIYMLGVLTLFEVLKLMKL